MTFARQLAIGSLALLFACAIEPGRVEVVFTWPDAPPSQGWLFVSVQERLGDSQPRLLASTTAVISQDVALTLPTVPNGDARVVVVEVRDRESIEGSRVLYRGGSAPFSVEPGVVARAEVLLVLARVPHLAGLAVAESNALGFVRTATVTFLLASARAHTLTIASNAELREPLLEVLAAPFVARTSSAGDELRVPFVIAGGDGPRSFYARVADAAGYASTTQAVALTVDREPPQVQQETVQVVLRASALNPVRSQTGTVAAATLGTTIELGFRVSEPLVSAPQVRTVPEPGFVLSSAEPDGEAYRFEHLLADAGVRQGVHAALVRLQDRAGWVATTTLAARFDVDTSPEAAPDAGRLALHRVPWGAPHTGLLPSTRVQAGPDACQPGLTMLVYDGEAPSGARLLGQAPTRADGSASVPLAFGDRTTAWAACADAAGNISGATPIHRGEWTATIVGKIPGESVPNPHQVTVTERSTVALAPAAGGLLEPEPAPVEDADGEAIQLQAAIGWDRHPGATAVRPRQRADAALAYDPVSGNLLLIGGRHLDERVWSWDGAAWSNITPAGGALRAGLLPGFVYDGRAGGLVTFGGEDMGRDTWLFDGQWRLIAGGGPVDNYGQFAYDAGRGEIVAFGGYRVGRRQVADDRTWIWRDGAWTQQAPDVSPPGRVDAALAYDAARGVTVLFGGQTYARSGQDAIIQFGDTWLWDGQTWREVAKSGPSPGPRSGHSMAYDPIRQRVVLFAGAVAIGDRVRDSGSLLSDVWEWDGASWREVTVTGATPGLRFSSPMTYDPKSREIVMFGGAHPLSQGAAPNRADDLWSFNGTRWRRLDDHVAPGVRGRHQSAYVESSGEVMMCCGADLAGGPPLSDVWHWSGQGWRLGTPVPSGLEGHGMTYDAARDRVVVFGGSAPDDYEWDGAAWHTVTSTRGPQRRERPVFVHHAPTAQNVLFAGRVAPDGLSDTWTWDGLRWTQRIEDGAIEGRRSEGAGAFDAGRGVVVVYGGFDLVVDWHLDVLEWNGATWRQVVPAGPSPGSRTGHALAYDSIRRRTMLFGGTTDAGANNDLWAWDGTAWRQIDVRGPKPPGMDLHTMAFHEPTGALVVSGGLRTGDPLATWTYPEPSGTPAQPALTFTVDWASADVPDTDITSVHVEAIAGGTGRSSTTAPALDGVELQAWDAWHGRWRSWATSAAGAGSPLPLRHTEASADLARFVGQDRRIRMRWLPQGGLTGAGDSPRLVVDHVAVRVGYQSP